jgi:hypothetical protein
MSDSIFRTESLQVSMYLHATGSLKFLKCEPSRSGKQVFLFADPQGIGDECELKFNNGGLVAATSLFASQKYLRRIMSQTENQNLGASHDRSNRYTTR